MGLQDEKELRERMLALAIQAGPERAVQLAGEFLAFVKAGSSGDSSSLEDTSHTGRGSG